MSGQAAVKALLLMERRVSSPEACGAAAVDVLSALIASRSFCLHDGPFKPNSVLLFKPKLRALSFAETLPTPSIHEIRRCKACPA
jgi:hypothetical protein